MADQNVLRRSADAMIPFLVGVLLGFMGSTSLFSSRLSVVETKAVASEAKHIDQDKERDETRATLQKISESLARIAK